MSLLTRIRRAVSSRKRASEGDAPDLSDAGSRDEFVGRVGSDEAADGGASGAERRAGKEAGAGEGAARDD